MFGKRQGGAGPQERKAPPAPMPGGDPAASSQPDQSRQAQARPEQPRPLSPQAGSPQSASASAGASAGPSAGGSGGAAAGQTPGVAPSRRLPPSGAGAARLAQARSQAKGKAAAIGGAKPGSKPGSKPASAPKPSAGADAAAAQSAPAPAPERRANASRSDNYYEIKADVFVSLMDAMDMTRIAALQRDEAQAEISAIVVDIIAVKNYVLGTAEQDTLITEICDDVLGYGPLEALLERDDIADIMVNGARQTFIETSGKIHLTDIRFRDNAHLLEICQRMVSKVGRRVDESSPICDARLLDGSRVNVIAPPLAIDGTALTIRKFKKDKLKLADLVRFKSISPTAAKILEIIGHVRCNVLISGGTGSGKTTLLNCLSGFAAMDERIITCEDSAELQLQQPHVVRLETRPPNIEGKGEITMRQLVKNCLRMRPERIIVGEVRGAEAFDLLQAMNTGHDGSMGTLHANSPREALSRLESMITMGGFTLPSKTIREMICSAVNVIVQAQRLRDGSRRITHITEVIGMEGETIVTQDLVLYKIDGEDENGKLVGRHIGCGIGQPNFYDRARTYNRGEELKSLLAEMDEEAGL
ncbi:MAG: Flp pilus assembly complex ATPase component TadA [Neomegalonema sp.]|nr:Flp pilus assembly complex ATPase component TadA [Neomegalonema sp.]